VLLLTFFLTVIFDLVVAIGVGLSLACLLFMTRMANVAVIKEWKYVEDEDAQGRFRHVPEHVMVYEIDGPMFFGAADQIPHIDPPGDDPADAKCPSPGHHCPQQPGPAVEGVPAAQGAAHPLPCE
jgi:HAMP domain-containing protein